MTKAMRNGRLITASTQTSPSHPFHDKLQASVKQAARAQNDKGNARNGIAQDAGRRNMGEYDYASILFPEHADHEGVR